MAEAELLTYELRDRVAWLGLNRPAKRNAISEALLAAIDAAHARASGEARAIVVVRAGVEARRVERACFRLVSAASDRPSTRALAGAN